jgi:hypothetical protein
MRVTGFIIILQITIIRGLFPKAGLGTPCLFLYTPAEEIFQVKKGCFPTAEQIVVVMDHANLRFENTHTIGSWHEAFEPEEARLLWDRLELPHSPNHGSWLNMAIALRMLNHHGLTGRIPAIEQMRQEVSAWNTLRNKTARVIDWRFITADARIKLKHLYPQFE